MADPRAWFESRHLRDSAEGAAALARLERCEPELREAVLAWGDRTASWSMSLAHAGLPAAVQAAGAGVDALARWEAMLATAAGAAAPPRDLALAFFAVDAAALLAWDAARSDAWAGTAAALGAASRRLAVALVQATAAAIGASRTPSAADLAALEQGVLALMGSGGWRGEFLAEAFLSGSALLLGREADRALPHWAGAVAALGTAGRNPKPPTLPAALAHLDAPVLCAVLVLVAAAAPTHPKAALRMLEVGPSAVEALPPEHALAILQAAAACPAFDALADSLGLLGGVLHGVPAAALPFVVSQVQRVAAGAPVALPALLRTVDRALEAGGEQGMRLWVDRGLDAAQASTPEAACAHFHLETRTAHKLLVSGSAAVAFEEVEGMLRRYLTMMSRRSFALQPVAGVWMRPPLVDPDDPAIRLPERIDLFDSADDNLAFYKILASHLAGRFEYGTYAFRMADLEARGWSAPTTPAKGDAAQTEPAAAVGADAAGRGEDLFAFLACFPNPLLASSLFVLLEGIRVDACLARDFPGLRGDLARMGGLYASTTVPAAADRHDEKVLETLFQMGLGHREARELEPRLRAQGEVLAASVELLRSPEACVLDSAMLTAAYYRGLAFAEARALEDGDEVAFAELGGATVVDPFEHLDKEAPRENTAPWRPDAAKAEPMPEESRAKLTLNADDDGKPGTGRPVSLEELRALLERGGDLRIQEAHGRIEEGLGLYITDLLGKVPAARLKELRDKLATGDAAAIRAWLSREASGNAFRYDEWDHRLNDYRRAWCRVVESDGDEDAGEYFAAALSRSGELVARIKRDFQWLRPDLMRRIPRSEQGEEFDLNALVEAHSDRRGRRTPSERLYVDRQPEERDVATLFLVDMSASTDEPLPAAAGGEAGRRVIDLARDTLVVLSQVLGEIGDSWAIYGFSGHGRENVEVYRIKSFGERLGDQVKSRLGGISPKRSTRMGAALRHAGEKLARTTARSRHLILLSDGFPQDFDYGDDRRSNAYGIRDTMQALKELEKRGLQTFCITVDPAGHDYLGEMCPSSRYAVIDDIRELPSELVRIYRRLTRA